MIIQASQNFEKTKNIQELKQYVHQNYKLFSDILDEIYDFK